MNVESISFCVYLYPFYLMLVGWISFVNARSCGRGLPFAVTSPWLLAMLGVVALYTLFGLWVLWMNVLGLAASFVTSLPNITLKPFQFRISEGAFLRTLVVTTHGVTFLVLPSLFFAFCILIHSLFALIRFRTLQRTFVLVWNGAMFLLATAALDLRHQLMAIAPPSRDRPVYFVSEALVILAVAFSVGTFWGILRREINLAENVQPSMA